MEDRDGDFRVSLISTIFCICVVIGGVFLVIYLTLPKFSQSWFLLLALILVGSPWLFWLLTYMYTCIKRCYCNIHNPQISQDTSRPSTMSNLGIPRNVSTRNSTCCCHHNSNYDEKHVKFDCVVEVDESGHSHKDGENA
ncbi:hypothetical protein RDI58_019830 [Solanum bulbocastanum]|uniref:Uncharacterized protein n=1 Tax=Solanum bulbocastanum TaxID=147425 RepID=A0AAN8Y7C0_SOLBU